jgi:hypothetical protein
MAMVTATQALRPVPKIEQAAALILTAFRANPTTVMTRRDVESMVNLSEFSVSTRWRALNHLTSQGLIREQSHWPNGGVTVYWAAAEQ